MDCRALAQMRLLVQAVRKEREMRSSSTGGLSSIALALIPLAIAINIAIGQLIIFLKIPLYLDSIGTVLVGVLLGPWMGALTGALTNIIWGLSGLAPGVQWFALTAAVIGLLAGFSARAGAFQRPWWVAIAGLITGIVAALISAPVAAYLFGGVTGAGTDFVVAFLQASGASVIQAAFGQGIVSDPIDKLASFLIVWAITQALPRRVLLRFPNARIVRTTAGQ
jgi:energy-coupling factor transport system substrate-specific component